MIKNIFERIWRTLELHLYEIHFGSKNILNTFSLHLNE